MYRCIFIGVPRRQITGRCSAVMRNSTDRCGVGRLKWPGMRCESYRGGVFDRHPSATLILGHMGEFLPFQRSRLDSRYKTTNPDYRLQRPPSTYLGINIVFTISGVFSPAALTGAVLEVGADAIMFSIDYPYESSQEAVEGFERTTLSPGDREKIA